MRLDTGRGTTFGVFEISTWFIHLSAAINQKCQHPTVHSHCDLSLRRTN
ncbi:unnamed protein product [Brassica rapa subsp. trilocularis]